MEQKRRTFSTILRGDDPVVRDHTVHGLRIMPGVTFLDLFHRMARGAGLPEREMEFRQILFVEPIAIEPQGAKKVVLEMAPDGGHWRLTAKSIDWDGDRPKGNVWQENARAELHLTGDATEFSGATALPPRGVEERSVSGIYDRMKRVGIEHRQTMRCEGTVFLAASNLQADLRVEAGVAQLAKHFFLIPALLDTATGLSSFAEYAAPRYEALPCVPIFIERFRAIERLGASCRLHLPMPRHAERANADFSRDERIDFHTEDGRLIARMEGLAFKQIRSPELLRRAVAASGSAAEVETRMPTAVSGNGVQGSVLNIMSAVLGKTVGPEQAGVGFYEMGFDSAQLLEVVRKLEERCGRQFYPTLLFEHPSARRLAEYLQGERVTGLAEEDVAAAKKDFAASVAVTGSRASEGSKTIDPGGGTWGEGIAVIGMSGRYPKARDLDEFWEHLKTGRDCVEEVPLERWDYRDFPEVYARWGGFISDHDKFDPLFFNLSPREAELMDPQERLFLEVVWATLEDAGYSRRRLKRRLGERGKAGVFVGAMWGGYQLFGAEALANGENLATTSGFWSLANRVSYLFDFNGPSMAIDTACSSSLTAIHLACRSLLAGECQVAIAGGVNLTLHPSKLVLLSQLKMASTDGRCRSFGEGGDGYVPAEGVGAVLLKPLGKAVADGDRIYGVIRGSAVNHGGRSNGYSVPDLNAQAALIQEALACSAMQPESVNYLEAHGTGTALGDPVEVAGLAKAFGGGETRRAACPMGSLKSSIGHLEAAAGVGALTKVLLQMRHGQIAPSIHADLLNAKIDFRGTHFFVQRQLRAWESRLKRAGISSFGVGGSNAHLVVDEWHSGAASGRTEANGPELIVLSAKNPERLREAARRLEEFLGKNSDTDLRNLAWTLQVGREALEQRLAMISHSVAELREQLRAYQTGARPGDSWIGFVRGASMMTDDAVSENARKQHARLLSEGRLGEVAELWVDGVEIAWEDSGRDPGRIVTLPSYPFAKERYWLPTKQPRTAASPRIAPRPFGPLLDSFEKTEKGAVFQKTFRLTDRVWTEHRVAEGPLLPGAAIIQMARDAWRVISPEHSDCTIKHVVWLQPMRSESDELALKLTFERAGEQYSFTVRGATNGLLHAQGKLLRAASLEMERIDLKAIRARTEPSADLAQIYRQFAGAGLKLGPLFQMIQSMRGGASEALADVCVPSAAADESWAVLALDSAIQSAIGIARKTQNGLHLPFSVDEVSVFGDVATAAHVHVALLSDAGNVRKFDIRLTDREGLVRARFSKIVSRMTSLGEPSAETPAAELCYFEPYWAPEALDVTEGISSDLFLLGDALAEEIRARVPKGESRVRVTMVKNLSSWPEALKNLASDSNEPITVINSLNWEYRNEPQAHAEASLGSAMLAVQELLRTAPKRPLRWIEAGQNASDGENPFAGMLSGVARTLRLEHPKHACKTVRFRAGTSPETAAETLVAEANQAPEAWSPCVFWNGERLVQRLRSISVSPAARAALRPGGTYLIAGGLGGLGWIFAREFASRCAVNLVLAGRRTLDELGAAKLEALRQMGAKASYRPVDLSNAGSVRALIDEVHTEFGPLHGVVQSAGVIEDAMIARKQHDSWKRVLAPKVQGSIHLDQATATEPLDWFVMFSSLSAVAGNIGQADYAAANAFQDSLAEAREAHRRLGLRRGLTLSINWPWWEEGGMSLTVGARESLARKFGLHSLPSADGIQVFFDGVASGKTRLAVARGKRELLERWLGVEPRETQPVVVRTSGRDARTEQAGAPVPPKASVKAEGNGVPTTRANDILEKLISITADVLKLRPSDLDPENDLREYGVDSVSLMTIVGKIEEAWGIVLEPSALTEHPTLARLTKHLASELPELPREDRTTHNGHHTGAGNGTIHFADTNGHAAKLNGFHVQENGVAHASNGAAHRNGERHRAEPVAVIGACGRFAGAASLERFWARLRAGEDFITEAPPEAWRRDLTAGPHGLNGRGTTHLAGSFLEGVDLFDPGYFGIREADASGIDPQQRLALELAQELLDRAGYTREEIKGRRVAVMLGAGQSDYVPNRTSLWPEGKHAQIIVNQLSNMVAARISDFYHWRGPSWTVDTACSASLVAIHQACQSLRHGEAEMAMAGGVQLLLDASYFAGFQDAGVLSPSGRCAVFDKRADGMVLGEGAGLVLLKRFPDALRDGDQILGVIAGSAVNNDGHTMGLTTPSLEAQEQVIAAALQNAGVDPATIGYLEAHGTGTALGDPIEIKAATQVYRKFTDGKQFCGVGSLKSNLGHLLRAAGVASFLKVLGAFQGRILFPTLHCEEPHPRFRFEDSPFYPVTKAAEWARKSGPRRAGLSSFGFGGTNCHMIVEEFEPAAVGYQRKRSAKPATTFQRKRYWLGEPANERNEHAAPEDPLRQALRQLKRGEISVQEAHSRIG